MVKYFGETDNKTRYYIVNLNKMRKNYIAITSNKIDCIGKSDDVASVPVSYRKTSVDKKHKKTRNYKNDDGKGSGVALLFLCVMANDDDRDQKLLCWNDDDAKKLK